MVQVFKGFDDFFSFLVVGTLIQVFCLQENDMDLKMEVYYDMLMNVEQQLLTVANHKFVIFYLYFFVLFCFDMLKF